MRAQAVSKYIRISPYKLRPLVDVVRGNTVEQALAWLAAHATVRTQPIQKAIYSAFSNAKVKDGDASMRQYVIEEIKVDGGPTVMYFKPGAMGRSNVQRKRMSHLAVVVGKKETQTQSK